MDNIISRWHSLYKTKLTVVTIGMLFSGFMAGAQTTATTITGSWFNQEKTSKIEIYQEGGKFFGKIIWLKEPNENGKPKTDNKNPDNTKHDDPIIGLVMLKDFVFDGKSAWEGGKIYDARTGKTYSCILTLQADKTLKVRGYMGITWFGQTNIWTRIN